MSDLTHLFRVGQSVHCNFDGRLHQGVVKETHQNYIIVDVPDISDHCMFENGVNMDCVLSDCSVANCNTRKITSFSRIGDFY